MSFSSSVIVGMTVIWFLDIQTTRCNVHSNSLVFGTTPLIHTFAIVLGTQNKATLPQTPTQPFVVDHSQYAVCLLILDVVTADK